jgi:hypothetical protein
MKRTLCCLVLLTFSASLAAQTRTHQQGTIVRMRMTDCVGAPHGFMAVMSGGGSRMEVSDPCPEYVLISDTVVYVITGKTSDQLLPLAEVTRFRLQKNEMLIRIDDACKESHFHIKAMVLRPEWDRNQMLEQAAENAMARHHLDPALLTQQQ